MISNGIENVQQAGSLKDRMTFHMIIAVLFAAVQTNNVVNDHYPCRFKPNNSGCWNQTLIFCIKTEIEKSHSAKINRENFLNL